MGSHKGWIFVGEIVNSRVCFTSTPEFKPSVFGFLLCFGGPLLVIGGIKVMESMIKQRLWFWKKKILWCGVYLGGKNLSFSRCLEEGVFFGFCGDVRKVRKSVKKEKRKKKGKGDSELGSHKGWGARYIILNICF